MSTMKPWREVAIPHADVLKGTFLQSELAADITAVHTGKAEPIYQDPAEFFQRTYITEGMRLLLTQVAQRLSGQGGEPVIQVQTAFGGGKTHTMLAVLHLANQACPLSKMPGVPPLIEKAGLLDVPRAKVAVLDGIDLSPSKTRKQGKLSIKTLWGELAWQLGGSDGFALVREADETGTSPGKETLRQLLAAHAPCVVLMDELVAYVRQFPEGAVYAGGTYESNLSFLQALTEAVKLVPTAVVLASLPESDAEAGDVRGVATLRTLERIFGRVQALWKPIAIEEAFEIVRRRLFDRIDDLNARDSVCRAFAEAYTAEGAKLPSETREGRYFDRLCQAYPIHPEVFDRLYEDWTPIGLQRTRGVLKLMAKAISRLWKANNTDYLILPGSLPLADSEVRTEMTYLLPPGWDPVIEGEIDGDRAETTELEAKEPRFGQVNAARRVARTIFLGTAPSSEATKPGIRGVDRGRILLGCLQPGQSAAVYTDALSRLLDRLHYLYPSGDKEAASTRFWFDTRANLSREMGDRKARFNDKTDVRPKIEEVVKKLFANTPLFGGIHVFTPHADVPDDDALRLVVLPPESWYLKDAPRQAADVVQDFIRSHGAQPRHRANRLLFLAADSAVLNRLKDATRVALAWSSIVADVEAGRLNIDQLRRKQASEEMQRAIAVLPRAARECFKWLLCPVQDDPTASRPTVEAFPLNTGSGSAQNEVERVCRENELVIEVWSPIHLRAKLKELYWKPDRAAVGALAFWEDTLRYLYLPRLKSRDVLAAVIRTGATSRDFFGTAEGQTDGKFEGFHFGEGSPALDNTLLLIEPSAAARYEAEHQKPTPTPTDAPTLTPTPTPTPIPTTSPTPTPTPTPPPPAKLKSFRGSVEVSAATAKSKLNKIAEEIIALLHSDPNAEIQITVEIDAEFPQGVNDQIRRGISENATTLSFKVKEWE